jgi:hypothetical protein
VGGRNTAEQSGFSRIGETDQTNIGEQFQCQVKPPFLPRLPWLGNAWRLANGSGKMGVASAAFSSFGGQKPLSVLNQISEKLFRLAVYNKRPKRDRNNEIIAIPAIHPFAAPVHAVFSASVPMILLVA